MRKRLPVVGKYAPYMGFASFPDPIILPQGKFAIAENLRSVAGVATVRNGMDRIVNTTCTTGMFVDGAWNGYLGGAWRRIIGLEDSGAGKHCLYNADSGAEITAGSGQFGDTRLTQANETQYHPQFSLICDQLNNTSKLVVCNGTDAPRIVYHDGSNYFCVRHEDIAVPTTTAEFTVRLTAPSYLALNSNAYTAYTADGGGTVTGADDATKYHPYTTTAGNACKFSVTTSAASGKWAQVDCSFAGDATTTASQQMWLIVDTWITDWLDTFAISLSLNGGAQTTVWDPSAPASYIRPLEIGLDATSKMLICITLTDAQRTAMPTCDAVRFTYTRGYVPYEAFDFWVSLIAFSGAEHGGTEWGVTRYNPYSHAESPGAVFSKYTTQSISDLGGPAMRGLRIPNIPELCFYYSFRVLNPSTSEANGGTSQIRLYAKIEGSKDFFLSTSHTFTTWGGASWTFYTGSAGTELGISVNDLTSPHHATLQPILMPDAQHKCIPTDCVAPMLVGNRLCVSTASSAFERYDTVWFSTFANPYRFRKTPKLQRGVPNEESAFTINLAGESVKSSVASSTGTLMGAVGYIFTGTSVYAMSGVKVSQLAQFSRISPYGIMYHSALAEHDGMIAWHSANNQVVLHNRGNTSEISYNAVDDRVDPITVSPYSEFAPIISMAFRDSKLYCAYRYTSSYQYQADRVLVYDMRVGDWVGDDIFAAEIPIHRLLKGEGGAKELVLYTYGRYAAKIKVYEYDSPGLTTDEVDAGAANISWTLRSQDYTLGHDLPRFTIGRVGVMCTKQASGTMDIERGYRPSGVTATSSISLTDTPSELHKFDGAITCTSEHRDSAAYVELSGSSPGGFQIFTAYAEIEARGESASS